MFSAGGEPEPRRRAEGLPETDSGRRKMCIPPDRRCPARKLPADFRCRPRISGVAREFPALPANFRRCPRISGAARDSPVLPEILRRRPRTSLPRCPLFPCNGCVGSACRRFSLLHRCAPAQQRKDETHEKENTRNTSRSVPCSGALPACRLRREA